MQNHEVNETAEHRLIEALANYRQDANPFLSIELIALLQSYMPDELSKDDLRELFALQRLLLRIAAAPASSY